MGSLISFCFEDYHYAIFYPECFGESSSGPSQKPKLEEATLVITPPSGEECIVSLNCSFNFRLFVDDHEVVNATPPDGGFFEFGNLTNELPGIENPWRYGSKMAPFDKDVSQLG